MAMMDLPATLEPVDCFSQGDPYSNGNDDADQEPVWGRLLPLAKGFTVVELRRQSYSFGRSPDGIDVSFDNEVLRNHKNFNAYSKLHFKVFREDSPTPHTIIEDFSSNGTFVNGEIIGKNKRRVLNSNDEIAMALPACRAFVYVENEIEDAPVELQQRYVVSRLLGRGAMGEVRLAYAKETWTRAALKIVPKTKLLYPGTTVDLSKEVAREIGILRSVQHPCVVQLYDIFDLDDKAFIIMELIHGGELFTRIIGSPKKRLTEDVAKLFFYQILLAVKYLHDMGITHRDLKPENILLATADPECLVKVTDFGLSKFIDSSSMMKTLCGTPDYLAPEVVQSMGTGSYTKLVDMWSLGVILFVMLSGYMPFSVQYKDMTLRDQILKARYTIFPKHWQGVSNDALDLVKKLLTVDPAFRPTADVALEHVWLKDKEMRRKAAELMGTSSIVESMEPVVPGKRPIQDEVENGCEDLDSTIAMTKKPCYSAG